MNHKINLIINLYRTVRHRLGFRHASPSPDRPEQKIPSPPPPFLYCLILNTLYLLPNSTSSPRPSPRFTPCLSTTTSSIQLASSISFVALYNSAGKCVYSLLLLMFYHIIIYVYLLPSSTTSGPRFTLS